MADPLPGVPGSVRVAAVTVVVLAVAFGGLAVAEFASTRASRPEVGITTGLAFAGYAVLLLITARGLARLRPWARSVAIFAGLLQIPVAISFWGGQTIPIAVAALVASIVIIGGLITPAANQVLGRNR
ncbi:hypothetical protein [Naumannella cuiyingiana]|uniref:Integral membrane protein n=1 Tax=Naumannella cuiyingiana TaxID=1347891 RepID=A0A7Z0IJP0_9ACTN|nr:hypothetical protein [Naumannella cuiyingiana]NYI69740.1 hypothetical protein [Naumannella cuiyingiana]